MPKPTTASAVTYTILVVLLTVLASLIAVNTISFEDDLQSKTADLLTNLGVLLIVVERALEIYTNIWRRSDRAKYAQDLSSAEEYLKDCKSADQTTSTDATKQAVIDAMNSRDNKKKELEDYRAETGKLTIRASLIIGIVISAIGFRVLEFLFIADALTGIQLQLFNYVDILLSAGVLAGGSAGIHTLTSTLGQFFESTKQKTAKN